MASLKNLQVTCQNLVKNTKMEHLAITKNVLFYNVFEITNFWKFGGNLVRLILPCPFLAILIESHTLSLTVTIT